MAEYIIMESVDSINRDGPDTPYVLGIYQYQEHACKMIVHVRRARANLELSQPFSLV